MNSLENDKRTRMRLKQEFVVGIKTDEGTRIAYLIDVSRDGVKVGTPVSSFHLEMPVEIVIDNRGERLLFKGRVERNDGTHYIDRIHSTANAIFIKIDDDRFPNFVNDHYYI